MGCQPSTASVYDASAASAPAAIKMHKVPEGRMFDGDVEKMTAQVMCASTESSDGTAASAESSNGSRRSGRRAPSQRRCREREGAASQGVAPKRTGTATTEQSRHGEHDSAGGQSSRCPRQPRHSCRKTSKASGFSAVSHDVVFLRGSLGETTSSRRHAVLRASLDPSLTMWHLGKNDLGDRGAAVVAEALAKSSKIELLGLGHNDISDSGAMDVAAAMTESGAPLRVACFMHNDIGDAGVAALAAALPHCPELEVLDLRSNAIGPEGARRLAEALQSGCAVKKLQLGGNQLGDEGARALAKAWKNCPSLEELALEDNGVSDVGATALVEALRDGSTLNLLGNGLSAAGKRTVRSAKSAITRGGACCTVAM